MRGSIKSLITLSLLLAASVFAQPVSTDNVPGRYTLLGTIGQSYLVRMDLERTGDQFKGRYHYERPGAVRPGSRDLSLTGRIDSANNLELIETTNVDGREVRTGQFNGVLRQLSIDGQMVSRLDGTWTRARDRAPDIRRLPFILESPRLVFGDVKLSSRDERDENQALNYTLRLHLPALGEAVSKFNRHVAAIVDPLVAGFKKDVAEFRRAEQGQRNDMPASSLEVDYVVVQSTPELMSLQFSIYSYTGGPIRTPRPAVSTGIRAWKGPWSSPTSSSPGQPMARPLPTTAAVNWPGSILAILSGSRVAPPSMTRTTSAGTRPVPVCASPSISIRLLPMHRDHLK